MVHAMLVAAFQKTITRLAVLLRFGDAKNDSDQANEMGLSKMKAPYPTERSHPVLLYQTFAFISEKAYDDIPFIDTCNKLIDHIGKMVASPTAGRGRKHDFAITRDVLKIWYVNGNSATKRLINILIWVGDEDDDDEEHDGTITWRRKSSRPL